MKGSRLGALVCVVLLAGAGYAWFLRAGSGWRSRPAATPAHTEESSKDAVLAAYKQLEKAVQTGDANLYLSLQSQKKLAEADKQAQERFRQAFSADPSVRYEVLEVRSRGDVAAVLGKITDSSSAAPQYYLAKFVLENGSWRIVRDEVNAQPIDTSALEAAVPPKDGAFSRSGSPWNTVPYATANTKWFKEDQIDWKLQAVQDESYLYIRFEAKVPLPAPGTELPPENAKTFNTGAPAMPNVMMIKTAAGNQLGLQVANSPMTRATFDDTGRATSNRYFTEYSFMLRNAEHDALFSDGTSNSPDSLIAVRDRFLEVRLPLRALGVDAASSGIELSEANSLAKILPYQVTRVSQ